MMMEDVNVAQQAMFFVQNNILSCVIGQVDDTDIFALLHFHHNKLHNAVPIFMGTAKETRDVP